MHQTTAERPLIVIGLDAAEHRLVSRWCDAGDLPTLRSLRDAGAFGLVRSPDGIGDDGAWASFCTGVLPARHGRYHHRQLQPGRYTVGSVGPLGRSPFWETLSHAGRRLAIVDVPKSPQSAELNGVRISNWLVHGRNGGPGRLTPPACRHRRRHAVLAGASPAPCAFLVRCRDTTIR
ncbi:MAG: alkaline phosphatase family protein [Candidatus Rokuibacteriota bacterium]